MGGRSGFWTAWGRPYPSKPDRAAFIGRRGGPVPYPYPGYAGGAAVFARPIRSRPGLAPGAPATYRAAGLCARATYGWLPGRNGPFPRRPLRGRRTRVASSALVISVSLAGRKSYARCRRRRQINPSPISGESGSGLANAVHRSFGELQFDLSACLLVIGSRPPTETPRGFWRTIRPRGSAGLRRERSLGSGTRLQKVFYCACRTAVSAPSRRSQKPICPVDVRTATRRAGGKTAIAAATLGSRQAGTAPIGRAEDPA